MQTYQINAPNGVVIKYYILNEKIKFFIFFKNKVYSLNAPDNSIIVSGRSNHLFIHYGKQSTNFTTFCFIEGIFRGLLQQWVMGLSLVGVGFRFICVKKRSIIFKLGASHLIKYYFNENVEMVKSTKRPTKLIFFSKDKHSLSLLLYTLRLLKRPDNYKGKGIQLFRDIIVIKKREKFGVF